MSLDVLLDPRLEVDEDETKEFDGDDTVSDDEISADEADEDDMSDSYDDEE